MEKVMPSFEYEPLVLFLEPKTLDEEEDKGIQMGQDKSCRRVRRPQRRKG